MARKVNKKFVIIISVVVLALVFGAALVYRFKRRDPRKLIAVADALMAEGKYQDAGNHYVGAAMGLKDPTLWTKAGDVFYQITYDDRENIDRARQFWSQATSIDAGYVPALTRLLNDTLEVLDLGGQRPEFFDRAREFAEKIVQSEPDNKLAKATLPTLVIRGWLSGIETAPDKVDAAVKQLQELRTSDPQNADIPYYIARAQIRNADAKMNTVGAPTGEALYAEPLATIDAALKAQDENGDLHFRAAQVIGEIGGKF